MKIAIWEPAMQWYGDAAVLNEYFPKWNRVTIEVPDEENDADTPAAGQQDGTQQNTLLGQPLTEEDRRRVSGDGP